MHLEAMADQHGVKHLAQAEHARRGDDHRGFAEVGGAPLRQRQERRTIGRKGPLAGGIAFADEIVGKGLIGCPCVEVPAAAQRQGLVERRLEMAMRAFDRAVLVADTAIVAGRRHAVVGAQLAVGAREVLLLGEVLERRREAVGTMLARRATDEPERVLEAFGERREALPTLDHARVFPLRVGEREVVEPMREGKARHRHAQLAGIGEVRKTLRAGRMLLAEDDVAVGPGERAPAPDMALQGAQLAIRKASGMPTLQLAQDGDRLQRRHRLHQRHDLGFPDPLERVGARPIDPRLLAL